jgi:hypothetical protein
LAEPSGLGERRGVAVDRRSDLHAGVHAPFLGLRHRLQRQQRRARVIAALAITMSAIDARLSRHDPRRDGTRVRDAAIASSAIIVYRRGFRPARNFLIAWGVLLAGVVAYANVSVRPVAEDVHHRVTSARLGGEMILLSFALAYRINPLREESQRILERGARTARNARRRARARAPTAQ